MIEGNNIHIEAFQLGEEINLKKLKTDFSQIPILQNAIELLYKFEDKKFISVFNYGVIVFAGFTVLEQSEHLVFFKQYVKGAITEAFIERIELSVNEEATLNFKDDVLTIPNYSNEALQIVMLNVAQSATLDYYESLSFDILNKTKAFTDELEQKGKISANKTNLLKFIGRTLNIKHSIIDNLYVFDAPDITWDDEYLSKLDSYSKKIFDIRARYMDVDYRLKIVQDNVTLFTDLVQHKEDNRLEWTVIILILIEVCDLIFSKVMKLF